MSSTSTTYSQNRLRWSGRRDGHDERSTDQLRSRDFYREASRESQARNGEWSRDKLKHELSSFIAEFSYLTDTSNKTKNTNPIPKNQLIANKPQSNLQVYNARQEPMTTPFENHDLRKRGVGWEDRQIGIVNYNVQEAAYSEEPSRTRVIKHGRFMRPPRVKVRKSRSARRSCSRDMSCPRRERSTRKVRRRFSNFRASKSRSQCSRKVRSRSLTPMRRRVRSTFRRRRRTPSCSRSRVRDIPFRHRRTKSKEIVIKRSKQKIIYKTIEPCAEPTLVTLFPKAIRPMPRVSVEPELPCKCAKCTNKFKSLARLYQDPCFDPCMPQCLPICAPCVPTCPPKCQVVPRNCNPCAPKWHCNTGGGMCNRPWGNQCRTIDCCQPIQGDCCQQIQGDCCQTLQGDCCQPVSGKCFKSVCFRFGTVGQNLNSNITQYFHSILDRRENIFVRTNLCEDCSQFYMPSPTEHCYNGISIFLF